MKQTARNNAFLAKVKKCMSRKIFKKACEIFNAEGLEKTQEYLAQFINVREKVLESDEEEPTGTSQ